MKRTIGTAVGLCLLAGAQALAQTPEKQAVETTTKQTGAGATLKSETQSVTGTVRAYEAGKTIKLSAPGDRRQPLRAVPHRRKAVHQSAVLTHQLHHNIAARPAQRLLAARRMHVRAAHLELLRQRRSSRRARRSDGAGKPVPADLRARKRRPARTPMMT